MFVYVDLLFAIKGYNAHCVDLLCLSVLFYSLLTHFIHLPMCNFETKFGCFDEICKHFVGKRCETDLNVPNSFYGVRGEYYAQ